MTIPGSFEPAAAKTEIAGGTDLPHRPEVKRGGRESEGR